MRKSRGKNRKPVLRTDFEITILRRRALTETVFFDALKNLRQLEHVRHRPVSNFTINLMARIMAYPEFGVFFKSSFWIGNRRFSFTFPNAARRRVHLAKRNLLRASPERFMKFLKYTEGHSQCRKVRGNSSFRQGLPR
jgi:hypothetical protein